MKFKKLLCSTILTSMLLTGCASGLFQNHISEENDPELANLKGSPYLEEYIKEQKLKKANSYNQKYQLDMAAIREMLYRKNYR